MIINSKNKAFIDKINTHDTRFEKLEYNYNERTIQFIGDNYYIKKTHFFKFCNVIYCDIKSCEFWGKSNELSIIVWEENQTILQKLKNEQESNSETYQFSQMTKNIDFFTIVIEIKSGDYITIICEEIEYEEKDLEN